MVQSIFVLFAALWRRAKIVETNGLGGDFDANFVALDSRESGRLAIRLSLRDDFAAVDIYNFAGKQSQTYYQN